VPPVPPLAVRLTLVPAHRLALLGVIVIVGELVMVTSTVWVLVHIPLVQVTVYVVLLLGVAVTVAPVVALNPVLGDQV